MPELLLVGPNPVKKIKRKRKDNPVVSTPALKRKKNPAQEVNKTKSPLLGKKPRRKNPIGASDIYDLAMQGAIGATGAIGLDFAAGYILPTIGLQVDYADPVYMAAKAVMALAAGEVFADATKGLSYQMASGGLTSVMTDYARTVIKASAPTVTLGNRPTIPGLANVYVAGSTPPWLAGYGDRTNTVLQTKTGPCLPCTAAAANSARQTLGGGLIQTATTTTPTPARTFGGIGSRRR